MDPSNDLSELPNLSKKYDNVHTEASEHRKNLVQLYQNSCKINDNLNTTFLLERELKKYTDVVLRNDNENIYQHNLQKVFNRFGIKEKPRFQYNFNQFDIDSVTPKDKNFNKFSCSKCENYNECEYENFQQFFNKSKDLNDVTRKVSKGLNKFENAGQSKLMRSNSVKSADNIENEFESALHGQFKSAREVLEIQTAKKNGNFNSNSAGQGSASEVGKKKLGIRRTVTSKFVSPLITYNSTEEASKSEESQKEEVDERLKNIDQKMVELIKSEIMDCGPNIHWDDIAGLEFAKTAIQEAVVWPMLRPDIFTGLRRPPKGILLFGPPGTGKTLIGKCVASQSKSTFFSISASSLTSKWVGDGEKMVRALFSVARVYQPAVIFIDEIDSLLSQRSNTEHESSRRIKTEFLVQLDGATTDSEERILVIGATNRPQELDEAARRRFVKRLYIPLPDYNARLQLLQKLIENENHEINNTDFKDIARLSDGYSGADIRNLCAEASLGPIRSIDMSLMEKIKVNDVRPLIMEDFKKAFNRIRSSVSSNDLDQYIAWDQTYGSGL